jgi:hypothetical protein
MRLAGVSAGFRLRLLSCVGGTLGGAARESVET